jgi:hypothetical protein
VLADSLQRFNIEVEENLSEAVALAESIKRGEQWLKEYEAYFTGLQTEFIHWDSLKQHENYKNYSDTVQELINCDHTFQMALDKSANEYMQRPLRQSCKNALTKSRAFLQEECAVFQVLAETKASKAIFYPGKSTAVLDSIIGYINNKMREGNPLHWIELRPTKKTKTEKLFSKNSYLFADMQRT